MSGSPALEFDSRDVFALLADWYAFMEISGLRPRTYAKYRDWAWTAWGRMGRHPLDTRQRDITEYFKTLSNKSGAKGQTLRALRHFYKWADAEGVLIENPTRNIRLPKKKLGPAPYLTPDDFERLLAAAERIDPRARPAIELAYATGGRVGSLCAVTPEDCHEDYVWFREAKNDDPYKAALGKRGRTALTKLLALHDYVPARGTRKPGLLIGVGTGAFWKWVAEAGRACDPPIHAWPHLIRHTTVTRLAENGVPERVIMEVANWKDGSQFRRYAGVADRSVREAVEDL